MSNFEPDHLEKFVHRALRELPEYKAPASLEIRVRTALAVRARAPWWQRGWQNWPIFPRTAILAIGVIAATVLAWLPLAGSEAVLRGGEWLQQHAPWLATIRSLATTLVEAFGTLAARYHASLLIAFAVLAVAYVTTVGVSAGIYRFLAPEAQR